MYDSKPAVKSLSVWSGLLTLGIGISQAATELLGSGFVPASWTPWLAVIGGAGTLLGRLRAVKIIEGIF